MRERFLDDQMRVLREAPPPRRYRWWVYHAWTLPAGLSFGFGLYAVTFGRAPWTGAGFLAAGLLIVFAFSGVSE